MVRGKTGFLGAFSVALTLSSALAGTPTSARVPCTDGLGGPSPKNDYTGPAEWGRRKCSKVKPEIKQRLEERVAHQLAYIYDGHVLYFAPNNVGFCKGASIKRPVCEIGTPDQSKREGSTNFLGQRCGEKVRGNPADDRPCFSKRPLPLDKNLCGPDRYAIGMGEVKSIQKFINQYANDGDEGRRNHAGFWAGLLADQGRSTDHLMKVWTDYINSGNEYCSFSSSGVNMSTCGKENAWISGLRVSAMQYAHEQVRNEIEAGTIKLVDFGGHRPCGEFAQSIEYALNGDPGRKKPGIRSVELVLREKYGNYKERAAGENKETDVCLGDIDSVADANRAIASAFSKKNEHGAGLTYVSQSACNLTLARRQVQNMFLKLATCEVTERTRKLMYENEVTSGLFKRVKDRVGTPCGNFAKGKVSFWDGCFEGCATRHFNDCYRGGHTHISAGIEQVVAEFAREKFPYTYTVKPSKLKVQMTDPTRVPAGMTNGQPVPDNMVPNCAAALSIVPFLAGGRRRRKSLMKGSAEVSQVLMVLAVVAMVFSGLGCDPDEAEFDPGPDGPACPFTATEQNGMSYEQGKAEAGKKCKADDAACFAAIDEMCAFASEPPDEIEDPSGDEVAVHESMDNIDVMAAKDGALVEKTEKEKDKKKKNLSANAATALTRGGAGKGFKGKGYKGKGSGDGGDDDGTAMVGSGVSADSGMGNGTGFGMGGLYGDGFGSGGGAAMAGADSHKNGDGSDKAESESAANRVVASANGGFGEARANGSGGPAGGTTEVDLGGGGEVKDLDGYLAKNGKLSLFEVINRRTAIWSSDFEAKRK